MTDFTCKEFIKLIDDFNLPTINRENALSNAGLPKNIKLLTEELANSSLISNLKQPIINYLHDLLSQNSNIMEPENLEKLLQHEAWINAFHQRNLLRIKNISGAHKNKSVMRIYNLHKESNSLSFIHQNNREVFKKFFSLASKLNVEVEEDSVVKVMYDIFENKSKNDIEFVKEIFAIYLENVATNPKYQFRVNTVKKWAETQDFSNLYEKYKNIRTLFEDSNIEEIFTASSKKYDLSKLVKEKGSTLKCVKNNFDMLNSFIEEKLKTNSNLQNFVVIDEKICHKVLFVYKERDNFIDSAIQMHELFFNRLSGNKTLENDLMNEIWDKLMLKAELKTDLEYNIDSKKSIKI